MTTQEILELSKEVSLLEENARNATNDIYFNNKDKEIVITRNDKEITIKQKDLWDEVRLDAKTNAKEILEGLYPEEMKILQEYKDKEALLIQSLYKNYGVNFEQMNPVSLINLISAIVEANK